MSTSLKIEDFSKICRMCLLVKNEMLTLHVPEVIKMIKLCVDVKVRVNDGYPQNICSECLRQLNNYSAFRLLCKTSDKILHKIVNDLNASMVHDHLGGKLSTNNNKKANFVKEQKSINVLNIPNSGNTGNNSISKCDLLIKEDIGDASDDDTKLFQEQDQSDNKRELCVKKEINENENSVNDSTEEPVSVHCAIDSKPVIAKSFESHLNQHNLENKLKCEECPISFKTLDNLIRHIKVKHEKTKLFKCEHCSETFNTEHQLDLHSKSHVETTHACDICDRKFTKKKGLKAHKKFVHGEKGYFLCVICQKSFPYETYLRIHTRRCHDVKSRAYRKKTCPICGKEFMKLEAHIEFVHNKNKRYKCDQCTKEFAFNSMLLKHVSDRHSGVKKEPEALCPICGKVCSTKGVLTTHLKQHDGNIKLENQNFDCNLCEKTYKTISGLQYHLMVHKKVRPHSCSICSKKFIERKQLRRHQRVHTGERPYVCDICGRSFKQITHMKTHMKVHNCS